MSPLARRSGDGARAGRDNSKKFEREFGSYGEFYRQIRDGNHQVLGVRSLGVMDVYDIEVFDDEPDDKRPWSEHNFAITPIGQPSIFGTHLFVANTRRAAKMQTLKCWHPDILEFIECKTKEEEGAGPDPRGVRGQLQRRGLQLGHVPEREPLGPGAPTPSSAPSRRTTTGPPERRHDRPPHADLQGQDADGQDRRGDLALRRSRRPVRGHDPALAYLPEHRADQLVNPCSEYMFIDDSACNLASINLMKFRREDGTFDAKRFRAAVRIFITAQEILVDHASYPTDRIALNSHKFRPLGLGYANLGSLLMASGLPYDSDEGRALAAAITAIMHGQAYLTSAEHAAHVGPFEGFALNREPMLQVMEMHRDAAEAIDRSAPAELLAAAGAVWDECLEHGPQARLSQQPGDRAGPDGHDRLHDGLRHDRASSPTSRWSSTSNWPAAACSRSSTGPCRWPCRSSATTSRRSGASSTTSTRTTRSKQAPGLQDEHLPVFDCAFAPPQGGRSIHFRGHLKMMAAVQPFLSGAISKTCNVPQEATVEDIRDAYLEGWKLGLKALAIYRDGSKGSQPVSTKAESQGGRQTSGRGPASEPVGRSQPARSAGAPRPDLTSPAASGCRTPAGA